MKFIYVSFLLSFSLQAVDNQLATYNMHQKAATFKGYVREYNHDSVNKFYKNTYKEFSLQEKKEFAAKIDAQELYESINQAKKAEAASNKDAKLVSRGALIFNGLVLITSALALTSDFDDRLLCDSQYYITQGNAKMGIVLGAVGTLWGLGRSFSPFGDTPLADNICNIIKEIEKKKMEDA